MHLRLLGAPRLAVAMAASSMSTNVTRTAAPRLWKNKNLRSACVV